MKNKIGFTLIELLAIIVILAIIAVITIPIILNVIDNSKRGAAIDSAYGYKEAINRFNMSRNLDDIDIEDGEYNISFFVDDGLEVNGEAPSVGWVVIENGEVTDFSIKIGDYIVTYNSSTNTTVAEKGSNVALTPTQEKVENYLVGLKTAKGNVSDVFNLPVEGVSSTDVTSGWVALSNGDVIGYSLQVGDKTITLLSKNDSIDSIVKTLATTYLNSLAVPNSETIIDVNESGKLKSGFIEYISNNSTISINDYSLKYEIDGVIKYANYDKTNNKLVVENIKHGRPVYVGNTIYIGNEGFYVMSVNNETATLLANTCLIDDNGIWRQITSTEDVSSCTYQQFSSSTYWKQNSNWKSEYLKDVNGNTAYTSGNPYPYIYYVKGDDSNSVDDVVDAYVATLSTNATGRLMTYEEANNLDISIRGIYLGYWLGSSNVYGAVFTVNEFGRLNNNGNDGVRGVRPIIEIPLSEIQ